MKPDLLNITFNDGKYTLIQAADGSTKALRYGEQWGKEITGDNFILSLGQEVQKLREHLQRIYELEPESPPAAEYCLEAAVQIAKEGLGIYP